MTWPLLKRYRFALQAGAGLLLGCVAFGLWAVSQSTPAARTVVHAKPLRQIPTNTRLTGKVAYAGTLEAPVLVFFAEDGRAFAQPCGEQWPDGCTAIQVQTAFVRSGQVDFITGVSVESYDMDDHTRTVLFSRAAQAEAFLRLELPSTN